MSINLILVTSGLFLCLINSAVSAQELSFDLENFKEVKTHLVADKATGTQAIMDWRDYDVSFAYQAKSVSSIIEEIMTLTRNDKSIIGLNLLDAHKPARVAMMKVKAFKAVTVLLKCAGFIMREYPDNYTIEKDVTINQNDCLY